jgi:hypothetical protein
MVLGDNIKYLLLEVVKMKECLICNEDRDLSMFTTDKRTTDGVSNICIFCDITFLKNDLRKTRCRERDTKRKLREQRRWRVRLIKRVANQEKEIDSLRTRIPYEETKTRLACGGIK